MSWIESNFNLSVVLAPCSSRDFSLFLNNNHPYIEKTGLEIIVGVRQDINHAEILTVVLQHPLVNWKILAFEHNNFIEIIDRCMLHAVKTHIMVCSPFASFRSSLLFELKYLTLHYTNYFISATNGIASREDRVPPGIIVFKKQDLQSLVGFGPFHCWTDAAENLISRLQRLGLRHLKIVRDLTYDAEGIARDKEKANTNPRELYYPQSVAAAVPDVISQPDHSIYSWHEASFGEKRFIEYVKKFKRYQLKSQDIFTKRHRVIALIQTYNEMRHMPDVFRHIEKFCDGIILLDDESTDGTYEHAESEKLLVKVQKKRDDIFNDLQNRNILFDLVSFFKADWIYTIDADERFDDRYNNIFDLLETPYEVLEFAYVNLWNNKDYYRVNYSTSERRDGIFYRKRMYRNIGHVRIITDKILHFNPVPESQMVGRVKILMLHHGTLTDQDRKNKYDFYIKEDPVETHYEHSYRMLKDMDVVLNKVKNIDLDAIISSDRAQVNSTILLNHNSVINAPIS